MIIYTAKESHLMNELAKKHTEESNMDDEMMDAIEEKVPGLLRRHEGRRKNPDDSDPYLVLAGSLLL